jgi:predicted hydrolase (HD superfamily)
LKPILTKEVFQATQDNTSLMKAAAEVRDNRKEVIQTTIATLTEMFKEKTIDLETFSLAIQNLQQS